MFTRRQTVILVVAGSICAPLTAPVTQGAHGAAHDARVSHSRAVISESGTRTVRSTGAPVAATPAAKAALPLAPDGSGVVLWTRNTSTPMVMTAALSLEAGVASGTSLNAPQEVALSELEGDGTPIWNSVGSNYRTAAAAHADVIAGADADGNDLVVRKWTSASATPDWTHTIRSAGLSSYQAIAVSDDGSTIAVLASLPGNGAKMLLYDAGSSTPISTHDANDSAPGRNIVITSDGRFAGFRIGSWAYVYDRDADALRQGLNTGANTDPITVSDDGQYIAFGFTNVTVREWTGSTYSTLWTRTPASSILRDCAISADGSTIVTTWSSFGGTDPFVEIHDLTSSVPDWTYDYPASGGTLQDIPSDVDITLDGAYVAVASWGNAESSSPQIHLFGRASATPLTTVVTPGSMFDVNVAEADNGVVYVSAGGKHVHANTSGNGGDVYAIRYGEASCPGDIDGNGIVGFTDLTAVLAAWGPCPGCPEDTDGDGVVGLVDLLNVLAGWGPCE